MLIVRLSDPAIARMPSTARTRFSVLRENASPVFSVIVTSTCPDAASRLDWKACTMVGRMMFMPKITSVPNTIASVVRKVRSLRPHR